MYPVKNSTSVYGIFYQTLLPTKTAPGNLSFRGPVGTVCGWTVLLVQQRVVSAGDAAEEVVE
ncbi:MAG: hypothetical protein NXI29_16965, partial [bacterium]|nr:hypothetical protein [bacterium]